TRRVAQSTGSVLIARTWSKGCKHPARRCNRGINVSTQGLQLFDLVEHLLTDDLLIGLRQSLNLDKRRRDRWALQPLLLGTTGRKPCARTDGTDMGVD